MSTEPTEPGVDWTSHLTPPPAVRDAWGHIRSIDVLVVSGTERQHKYGVAYFNKGWDEEDPDEPKWTDSGSESWTLSHVIAWRYITPPTNFRDFL